MGKEKYKELEMLETLSELPPLDVEHIDNMRDMLSINGHTTAPFDEYESDDWMADEYARAVSE
jgi:hypothetical protein